MFNRRTGPPVPGALWVPGHLLSVRGYFSLPQGQWGGGRDARGFQGELKARIWTHQVSFPPPVPPSHLSPWLSCILIVVRLPLFWEIWQLGFTNFTLQNSHGWRRTWWLYQFKLRVTYKRFYRTSLGQLPIVKWSAVTMRVAVVGGGGILLEKSSSQFLLRPNQIKMVVAEDKIWSCSFSQKSSFRIHYRNAAIYPRWPFLKTCQAWGYFTTFTLCLDYHKKSCWFTSSPC